jgi:phosphoribosylanthranilate isomerase
MTAVKICGVNSPAAFDAVVEAGADFLGFVFFPPSPRFVTGGTAASLSARHEGGPKRVGLFVKPSDEDIAAVLAEVRLDVLQIYADAARAAVIKTKFGLPVWRAIGVAVPADLPASDEGLDGFVIEAKPPAGATRPGGNATAMDFSLLRGWTAPAFWLLAGGLTPDNVADAITQTTPPGVDVSSGVETAPGEKSPDLIRRFVAATRPTPKTS